MCADRVREKGVLDCPVKGPSRIPAGEMFRRVRGFECVLIGRGKKVYWTVRSRVQVESRLGKNPLAGVFVVLSVC